ncbi:AMP-binding protein [Paenibacillus rhizovicinus]|uniref:acetate--CoA ligase n=1 Tax=Paenibacillus rhizovicinus TaxID=2704463 RepID=A0A6C0PA74_9BACL|nr:AMP-binding protein [Paenibacillus rhizovicinus]QHW35399.1 AMP-binding protein [Paenibacillus rhizovicinus]
MGHKPVWYPNKTEMEQTRLFRFMHKHGFDDYDAFYRQSIGDISWFWDAVVQDMDIAWERKYEQVVTMTSGIRWPSWFVGGRLNAADNAVDKWLQDAAVSARQAIIWEGEDGATSSFTYRELAEEVNGAAHGLRRLGIQQGDRVALYMPMIPETVAALLAIAKLGAICIPVYSGYGADAAAKRIAGAGCKLILTADGYYRRGKIVRMKEEADKAADASASVSKVVVVRRLGTPVPWRQERDVEWTSLTEGEGSEHSKAAPFDAVPMNSGDPLMILYTSGTTGAPKGIVHTHSGFPIKAAFDAGYAMDFRPGNVMLWITDMGWMMGPFLVYGTLFNAGTMVLYEGVPDFPGPERLFGLVQRHAVTHLGISPTLIRGIMKHGDACYRDCDISSLRVIGSTGEPWNLEPWLWLFNEVGKGRVPIVNYSGGTEISGGILGNVLLKPIAPVGFNSPIPGMCADVWSQEGKPVIGEVGELVLKRPWLGMAGGFWQEPERYEHTYWSRWPDIWVHGDWVHRDEDGYWTITGRSDDTLNVAGKRLGPAELESLLVEHPQVAEAAVIGVPDETKGEAAVCFVVVNQVLSEGRQSMELTAALFNWIAERLGKAFKPKSIHIVEALPRTRNAKVMRRVIRSAYLGSDPGDLSALENPEAVIAIRGLADGRNE